MTEAERRQVRHRQVLHYFDCGQPGEQNEDLQDDYGKRLKNVDMNPNLSIEEKRALLNDLPVKESLDVSSEHLSRNGRLLPDFIESILYGDLSPPSSAVLTRSLDAYLNGDNNIYGRFQYLLESNFMNMTHLCKVFIAINCVPPLLATAKIDFDIPVESELIYKSKEDRV